jgi:exosortase A
MRLSWASILFLAGLALLGWSFQTEVAAALDIWSSSTAYNHCWLVLPIALWLGWTRRARFTGPAEPSWLALPIAAGLGAAWWLADRLGLMEGRQLAALGLVPAWFLGVFGWRLFRGFAVPLGYLVFLVPFGAFLVPLLQRLTAWMIVTGLTLLGIPHFADALIIEIPAGIFLVAEACAGLRFLIASLAFGALYAVVMFHSPGRRLAVMVLALVVPVLANGLRALGIVLLGHHLGSAEAAAADHLIYGWVFFTLVILLLVAAGLPFRQDRPAGACQSALQPGRGAA